jgi:xylulokinase
LFSQDGEILEYISKEYDFRREDGKNYVDTDRIWANCKQMIGEVAKKHEISSFCISSLGEAFALLDKDDNVLVYPMLYTDPRGEKEAKEIVAKVGEERAFLITGVMPHSMYSLSKLLWIKNNYPEKYAKADKVLLVGEYIGYLLSGKRVFDYGLASRTGALDVSKLDFSQELLDAVDVPRSLFSATSRAGTVVGPIKEELIKELGIRGNPVLVLGSHDQICTSLGAGVLHEGEAVDGMGTVECITTLFKEKPTDVEMGRQGYPCVPYAIEGLYCTYILNYSCGSTVNWLRKKIMHGYKGEETDFFSYLEKNMKDTPTGILTLPYFGGASTPYQDLNAKGAIVNLTTETADADVYKSIMEGTAMEMRLNADVVKKYGIHVNSTVATGGGANSGTWLQIKSDIQNIPVTILRSAEGGLCGCALLQAVALGGAKSYEEAKDVFVRYVKDFTPNADKHVAYENQYKKYKKLYNTLKEMF